MKKIDSLVGDIYAILDEGTDHEPNEENLTWIADALKELLRSRLSSRERKAEALWFSSLGKPDRQLWYGKHKPEMAERMAPHTYMKFLYGDLLELLLLFLAKEAGHKVERLQERVEVEGVTGRIDAVIDDVTVDAKSASSYAFTKFKNGTFLTDDPFGYIGQISGYRKAIGTERAGFLVADKVHGHLHFAEVSPETLTANTPEPRIAHLRDVLQSESEPDKCYEDKPEGKSGNRILATSCSYCKFKDYCWRDANDGEGLKTYIYSSGPKFFTKVAKEPRVQQEDW
jgi:hypothetical protein